MSQPLHSSYIYFSCQHGAEATIKSQLCEPNGPYRLSYSQKGFVTLKTDLNTPVWSRALPESPLIRSRGHAIGKFDGEQSTELIEKILAETIETDWEYLHVWQRDVAQPGWHGFEPGRSPLAEMIANQFQQALQARNDTRASNINTMAPIGSKLLEVILVEPNRWWLAAKPVQTIADGWPGGVYAVPAPENMISRAYLKIAEAIPWSELPIRPGDRIVEIGSSPGGACQRLLDLGAQVTGIDPAEMDETIADNPRFEHWRSKSLQIKRRLFKPFRYLVCDANVAPNYTLDTVESIVTYPTSKFKGLILTIKLSSWEHAHDIPQHLERVRSWGFDRVQARQLAHNRREYCLVAERTDAT
jgi:23S rRNA (cytidine2498-2'-O)-methyltransferase